jgi:Tfp pilus assembly protein PilF
VRNPPRGLWLALSFLAFVAGVFRARTLPVVTDEAFQLVRVGNSLLSGSLEGYATPPGGVGAPPLGAIAAALGTLAGASPESIASITGNVLLGCANAAAFWNAARSGGVAAGLLAASLLLFPPAIASSFIARPDAGLGGCILLASFGFVVFRRPALARAFAWIATLTTPFAFPVATLLLLGPKEKPFKPSVLAPPLLVAGTLSGLTLGLPPASRGEIFASVFSGFTLFPSGIVSTLQDLLGVWAFGVILLAPFLLRILSRDARLPQEIEFLWALTVSSAIFFCGPGAFRGATAALAPSAAFLLSLSMKGIRDPHEQSRPQRAIVSGILIAFVLAFVDGEDRAYRTLRSAETARLAQIGSFLLERSDRKGPVASERPGALASYSARSVCRLSRGGFPRACPAPEIVVFRHGLPPGSPAERSLFRDPSFLSEYAPFPFRRGRELSIEDALWVRRAEPLPIEALDRSYAALLEEAWIAEGEGRRDEAESAWAKALEREPAPIGLAREAYGMLLDRRGEHADAEKVCREARERDPAAWRARGQLADRALTRGEIARADTLLREAFAFTEELPELWGTRARLAWLAGSLDTALSLSERALRRNPHDTRLLTNHGSLVWASGDHAAARELWKRAAANEPTILGYLGDFKRAPEDAPAPPLIPLFSLDGFSTREGYVGPSRKIE